MSSSKVSGGGDGEDADVVDKADAGVVDEVNADVVDEANAGDGAAEFFYSPSSSPLGLS